MFYEWRVSEGDHGEYVAEGGHTFSVKEAPSSEPKEIFVAFTIARFDTRKQAERYIARQSGKEYNNIWED